MLFSSFITDSSMCIGHRWLYKLSLKQPMPDSALHCYRAILTLMCCFLPKNESRGTRSYNELSYWHALPGPWAWRNSGSYECSCSGLKHFFSCTRNCSKGRFLKFLPVESEKWPTRLTVWMTMQDLVVVLERGEYMEEWIPIVQTACGTRTRLGANNVQIFVLRLNFRILGVWLSQPRTRTWGFISFFFRLAAV